MPQGVESARQAVTDSGDPILLSLLLVIFLIGAVVPFLLCILGKPSDRSAVANDRPRAESVPADEPAVANIDVANIDTVAAEDLVVEDVDALVDAPANDAERLRRSGTQAAQSD